MKSPHTVAHRESLAYKMFFVAAEARDRWLRKQPHGEFSATVQKYYTGMSLSRYVLLVGVEFPVILLFSAATWLCFPAMLFYFLKEMGSAADLVGVGAMIQFGFLLLCVGILLAAGIAAVGLMILAWAAARPSFPVRFLRKHVFRIPTGDVEDLEKFPGPIALIKKWILSGASGIPSQITWDSGKRRRW